MNAKEFSESVKREGEFKIETAREMLAHNIGFSKGRANPRAEEAIRKIQKFLGVRADSYSELADLFIRRFEGLRECERKRAELSRRNAGKLAR